MAMSVLPEGLKNALVNNKRIDHLVSLPIDLIKDVACGILGVGSGAFSILTLGVLSKDNVTSGILKMGGGPISISILGVLSNDLSYSNKFGGILQKSYKHIIGMIQPQRAYVQAENTLFNKLRDLTHLNAIMASKSKSLAIKHIGSRLTYLVFVVACVVTRVADAVIGLFAATLSLLTLGRFNRINKIAISHLSFPMIMFDLFFATTRVINPWADFKRG